MTLQILSTMDSPSPAGGTVASFLRKSVPGLCLAAAAFALLSWPTLSDLVRLWARDPDFSFGFLIPPICAWILYRRRKELASLPARRALAGLWIVSISLGVYFLGRFRLTEFFQRIGLYGAILGSVWFLLGPAILRACPFPFFFLLFCIPPPSFLLGAFRQQLRELATRISIDVLNLMGLAAVQFGNTLTLGDHQLEVADACCGIRSLMVIVAAAAFYAYLFRTGLLKGTLLLLASVPVAVAVNILRIVLLAVFLARFQLDFTEGLPHEILGLAVFGVSLGLLAAALWFLNWIVPGKPGPAEAAT